VSDTTLLALQQVKVAYGGIQAVKGVDLRVATGELVALIGANGAGKTTTLRAICGLLKANAGTITYAGEPLAGLAPYQLARRGLVMVPEGRGVFGQLTVEENLRIGAYPRADNKGVASDLERIYTLFPRLQERARQSAGTLSGGEQQMLAIGRALMSRPKLLLLDEPSMGLAPMMVQKIFETVVQVAREGVTTLLVEQNARLALQVSQRAYVLDSGNITLQGQASDLLNDSKVREAYLGE
jgi:branched-chain amino acid transport system ATP-binding protein